MACDDYYSSWAPGIDYPEFVRDRELSLDAAIRDALDVLTGFSARNNAERISVATRILNEALGA